MCAINCTLRTKETSNYAWILAIGLSDKRQSEHKQLRSPMRNNYPGIVIIWKAHWQFGWAV